MLQRAAELGRLDRAARGPRDAGGADAERREHGVIAAPPQLARGHLVERELLDQIGAARLVELVVVGLGERARARGPAGGSMPRVHSWPRYRR